MSVNFIVVPDGSGGSCFILRAVVSAAVSVRLRAPYTPSVASIFWFH